MNRRPSRPRKNPANSLWEIGEDFFRDALPLPASALAGELAAAPRALVDLRRAASWGGRPVPAVREAPVSLYRLGRDPRVPSTMSLAGSAEAFARRPEEIIAKLPGITLAPLAPRVVVEPRAMAALLKAFQRQQGFNSHRMSDQIAADLAGRIIALLSREDPTPGTHFALLLDALAQYHRPNYRSVPMPFAGSRMAVQFGSGAPSVPLRLRAARMGDDDLGVFVDIERAAEAPLPRWFPGMPAMVHADRDLTDAQRTAVAGLRGSATWRPVRVDVHPDGRARAVYVALNAPSSHFLASEKPPKDGTLHAKLISALGKRLSGDGTLDADPEWRPVLDIRLAPDPAAVSLPTFTQTSAEAEDASGSKQRGRRVSALAEHFTAVAQALRTGRPVAPEVVAEYPKLAEFYAASLRSGRSRAEVLAEKEADLRAADWADDPDVTVHWSVQEGLLLRTRGKDPKIIAAIKDLRNSVAAFKWKSNLGAWFRPQSVGVSVSTVPIDRVAQALRKAGLVVRVERGETTDLGTANERRQDHKFWRADLYADRAGNALVRGAEAETRADRMRADIPVGAPTRKAERAEARADRLDQKAADDFSYAEGAAGAAQNLAARAASYDVTATITRKEAERRVDAFANLFVRKVKGLVGAEKIYSDKTDNLSEYSISWGVLYPATAMLAAHVAYDGRTIVVRQMEKPTRDGWEHVQLARGRVSLHDNTEKPVTLRRDVTTLDADAVFALVLDALPRASKESADPAESVPTDAVAYQKELSAYAARRASRALTDAFKPASGFTLALWPARNLYGNGLRPMSVEEVRSGSGGDFPTGNSVTLVPGEGLTFRIVAQRVSADASRGPYWERKGTVVGEAVVDLAGVPIGQAWDLFVAHAAAMMSGQPFVAPKAARGAKGATLTGREDPRLKAMRGPAVRAGAGRVDTLARDASDAAARARAGEVSARVSRVAEDAADRLAERRREAVATEAHKGLLDAVRAAGNDLGFYPTPPTLAVYAVSLAGIRPGDRVLEPSAGTGSLVDALVAEGARVTALELQGDRAAYLRAAWAPRGVNVRAGDFLAYMAENLADDGGPFDAVVMNPPFSVGGRRYTDVDHVRHALRLVRPGGRVVAIMAPTTPTRDDAKTRSFREEIRAWRPTWEPVEPKRFRLSGTDVPTVLLTLTRP